MTMPWPAEAARTTAKGNLRNLRALLSCDAVSEELPLVVDGSRRPSDAMAEHLRMCLACQAELAGYRRLLRVLRSMRGRRRYFYLPPELVGQHAERSCAGTLRGHPAGPNPGVAALAAVGVVALGAGALWAQGRPPLPAASPSRQASEA